jgi:hypothetical protein
LPSGGIRYDDRDLDLFIEQNKFGSTTAAQAARGERLSAS